MPAAPSLRPDGRPPAPSGPATAPPRRERLALASLWLAASFLAFAGSVTPPLGTLGGLLLSALCTSLGLGTLALAGASLSAQGPGRRLGWVPSGCSPWVLAGLVLGMLTMSQVADWSIEWAGRGGEGNLAEFDRVVAPARGVPLWSAALGFALFPGIAEELALRGLLQRGLEARWGGPAAVVLSAAVFGALHGDVVHGSGAFFLGLYLGGVAWITGSIRPAVLCHVLNNGVATLGAALPPGTGVSVALALAGLVAGPFALRSAWRRREAGPASGGDAALGRNPEVGEGPTRGGGSLGGPGGR